MDLTKSYIMIMEHRRTPFSVALTHCLETRKNITQSRLSSATGIKQGMISGMKTGKREGTEESRRAIAGFFKIPYDEFLSLGQQLIDSQKEVEAKLKTANENILKNGQDRRQTPRNITNAADHRNAEHHKTIDRFRNQETALAINHTLVEIETLDPDALDRIAATLKAELTILKRKKGSTEPGEALTKRG